MTRSVFIYGNITIALMNEIEGIMLWICFNSSKILINYTLFYENDIVFQDTNMLVFLSE